EHRMIEDPEAMYGELLPFLQNSDLRVVNVEAVLGDEGEPIAKGGPNLKLDERVISGLTSVPFDVACLANNHTLDFGPQGLSRTIQTLEQAGIRTVGAGMNRDEVEKPLIMEVKGTRIGII